MQTQSSAAFPLSAQQKVVWPEQAAGSPRNSVSMIMLHGPTRGEDVRRALCEIVSRHEALRTVFRLHPEKKIAMQDVIAEAQVAWETIDIASRNRAAQENALDEAFIEERNRSFGFEAYPPLRATFFALGDGRAALILCLPALCGDGHSHTVIAHELGSICGRTRTDLPPEPLRYAQIAQWQTDLLESQDDDAQRGRNFWRQRVAPAITLPLTRESGEAPTYGSESATLESPFLRQLDSVAARYSASVEQLLLAAWQALIFRLTGESLFQMHVLFNGREYAELGSAIGLMSKFLPLVSRFDGGLRFREAVEGVKNGMADALLQQEFFRPGEGTEGVLPLAYEWLSASKERAYGECRVQVMRQEANWEPSILKLSAQRTSDTLRLEFGYDANRLDRETVVRWIGNFRTLLLAGLENPDEEVRRLALLTDSECRLLTEDWNRTEAEFPCNRCVHELFESQAERTPDRVAVRCNDEILTYRELNQRANRLAHYLRKRGVRPGSRVGLCVDRGVGMLLALCAILKAGAAVVPLEAETPKPRLAQQLEGAAALIVESKLLAQAPQFDGVVLTVNQGSNEWDRESAENPESGASPEDLAYVIYTSGSTGIPKGVAVRHRNLVNYSWFIHKLLELEKHPAGLHFATVSTLSADLGNTCIYPSLISGGCLHVVRREVSTDSQRMAEYNAIHPIDVLKIVPSHLAALLDSGGAAVLPRKYLITGGEALTRKLVEGIQAAGSPCQIVNHYGPTETTVGSLTLPLAEDAWRTSLSQTVPIGRPIANTRVYILDAHQQLLPIGTRGELYISGAGVTAGYLNQPELTGERFLPDPFAPPGQRMYRTGDVVRRLPDGTIEFLGRVDDQVKVRGFRVELGEIEASLSAHPAVKQAVAMAREDGRGDKRLVAYVIAHKDRTIDAAELRNFLAARLPDYMIPAKIVALPNLPLNANGKIDRRNLPDPEQVDQQPTGLIGPRNEVEKGIAQIWAGLLGREKIGIHNNFFELGGHSLLAIQATSRMRQHFGVPLGVEAVFEHPTIEELALVVEAAESLEPEADIARIPRRSS